MKTGFWNRLRLYPTQGATTSAVASRAIPRTVKRRLQLSALAEWLSQVIASMVRPGQLPDDFTLEPEYEPDFVAGDIAVAINDEDQTVEVTFESLDTDDVLELTLSKEWAGGLAIAVTRLVEAGRALCPLCGGPLDPKGHDCPRTNGHRPPIR